MTIKTKLKLAALFPIVFGCFIVFSEMRTIRIVDDVLTREKISGEILFGSSDLARLGNEFVQENANDRVTRQWSTTHEILAKLLKGDHSWNVEQKRLVNELNRSHSKLGELFAKLSAVSVSPDSRASPFAKRRQTRWARQIFTKTESMRTLAQKLGELCRAEIRSTQNLALVFSILSSAGMFIGVTIILLFLGRSIVTALSILQRDTEIVGTGDFEHRVNIEGKDEIGDLARAFHSMISQLKSVTASRDQMNAEIKERKLAEMELAEKEAQLSNAVDNMPGGIMMIEKDFTIRLFNERYIELYELPDGLLRIGGSLEDMIRFRAERGDYGPGDPEDLVQARTGGYDENSVQVMENRMPSGRILELTRNPIADGLLVAICTDITERKAAEQKIADAEARQRTLLESSPIGLAIVSVETGKRLFVNPSWLDMFGVDDEEQMLQADISDSYVDPEDQQRVKRVFEANGSIKDFETQRKRADGSPWWCLLNGLEIQYGRERVRVMWLIDITERKLTEAEIERQKAVNEAVLTNMDQGVVMYNGDMVVTAFNEQARRYMHFPKDVMYVGALFEDIDKYAKNRSAPGTSESSAKSRVRLEHLRNGKPHSLEYVHADGAVIEIRRRSVPDGGFVVTQTDITERKKAEERVREREQQFMMILESAPVGVSVTDNNSTRLMVNQRYADLAGIPKDQLIGGATMNVWTHPEDREEYARVFARDKRVIDMEFEMSRGDGSRAWVMANAISLEFSGEPVRVNWVVDLTDRKKAEEGLQKQTKTVQLLHETAVYANQAQGVEEAFTACLHAVCTYGNIPIGHIFQCDPNNPDILMSTDIWHLDEPERFDAFRQASEGVSLERGVGLPGRVLESGAPHWISNVTEDPNFPRGKLAARIGVKTGFAIPVLVGNEVVAVMEFFASEAVEKNETLLSVLDNIGTQIGRVVERKRTEEIINKAHNLITESVEYASKIQRSLLPTRTRFDATLGDHFVIWEPRDVVGGDFYWLRPCQDGYVLIVGDCTGHGVPGAFMTLIATGALDFAMNRDPSGDPVEILAHMNQFIKRTLAQDTDEGQADDGLELGVCRIEENIGCLTYAGARFALVVAGNNGIREIKGDKMGIGYRRSDPNFVFTNHRVELSPDLSFYLYSDGVVDQIGGEKRRGFGRKRFQNLLAGLQDRRMSDQLLEIQDAFRAFQGDELRRDDVTVVGFKAM